MKTILIYLIWLLSTFVMIPHLEGAPIIPENYYDMNCVIPPWMSVEEWLVETRWPIEYEAGGFDCSKMAAYTEWALENCGIDAKFMLIPRHAFVVVKLSGGYRIYQSTRRKLEDYDRPLPLGLLALDWHEDIYAMKEQIPDDDHFLSEFGWWEHE